MSYINIASNAIYGALTSTGTSCTTTTAVGPFQASGWVAAQPLPEIYSTDPMKQAIYEVLRAENPYNTSIYGTVQRIYRKITEKLLMEMWDVEGMIPAESAEERAAKAQVQAFQQGRQAQQAQQSLASLQNTYNTNHSGYLSSTLTSTY